MSATEPSLREIANRYGTDKGTRGPDGRWSAHNYTDVYEAYLWPLRRSKITMLEIGIGATGARYDAQIVRGRNSTGGASLKMWAEHFPEGRIYGLDINPAKHLDTDRISTHVADQGSMRELEAFVREIGDVVFDLIIDDGSHRPDHQQLTLSFLFKSLRSGGLYVIEDLGRSAGGVASTRTVLKTFQSVGKFGTPNALMESAYLATHIDFIHFHAPKPRISLHLGKPRLGKLRRFRPIVPVLGYRDGSDELCVLRKT